MKTIDTATFEDLKLHYNKTLNLDKSSHISSNDEPTPIDCISEMIAKLPVELWSRSDLKILDPCCGNGNFFIPILFELLKHGHTKRNSLESILEFNDSNSKKLDVVKQVFCGDMYALQVTSNDFLSQQYSPVYDLIVANPPYAKLLADGKRASKNHNLIKDFLEKSLNLLKPNGYLLFITPDNWMSYADRNTLITVLTRLQIVHLDIHTAKRYFPKVGSSFTWYIVQNSNAYKDISISGVWKGQHYTSSVPSGPRRYIPLLYTKEVHSILAKTIDNGVLPKFAIETSSDLHRYTKANLIREKQDETYRYRLIHTPKQTVYASRPHKFQDGFKVFLSTTDKYTVFVDKCGMTQSIAFLRCLNEQDANRIALILQHPIYVFLNNICRWGNFNNVRILQHFPVTNVSNEKDVYNFFQITAEEKEFIKLYS